MEIRAVYVSRCNGLDVSVDGVNKDYGDDPRVDRVIDAILERTDELCDEGQLEGDMSEVDAIVREEFSNEYGEGHEITVEEDQFSN